MEILELGIAISTFIFGYLSYITNHTIHKPLFGKQESQESIKESQNQTKIPKIPESRRRKFKLVDPLVMNNKGSNWSSLMYH